MNKKVTINLAEKRGRQRVNIVQPERDIERKQLGGRPSLPGGRSILERDCVPRENGPFTIIDDCRGLLDPQGVLYAWDPPATFEPPTVVVQWTYPTDGNALDDISQTYQFGAHKNVAGGFCRTKGLQPGVVSAQVPLADATIAYTIEASVANWLEHPGDDFAGRAASIRIEWRLDNSTVGQTTIATCPTGNKVWGFDSITVVPPSGTNGFRIRHNNTNYAWDNVVVYHGGGLVEDEGEGLIPPSLGRVYNQVATRVDGDTYTLCLDASAILIVRIDGMNVSGYTFDGAHTITLPVEVSSDAEVWVQYIA